MASTSSSPRFSLSCAPSTRRDTVAIGGSTFAWKDILNEQGFKFDGITKMWHASTGTDTDEVEAMMDDYGFAVEKFDTMMEA